ncbi:hypothetical protein BT69DRAFT_1280219 [Atractiella rhizophila]|nr:hypothetical protein BT69DRAFT_1280219 [Atractiella rhizophila]
MADRFRDVTLAPARGRSLERPKEDLARGSDFRDEAALRSRSVVPDPPSDFRSIAAGRQTVLDIEREYSYELARLESIERLRALDKERERLSLYASGDVYGSRSTFADPLPHLLRGREGFDLRSSLLHGFLARDGRESGFEPGMSRLSRSTSVMPVVQRSQPIGSQDWGPSHAAAVEEDRELEEALAVLRRRGRHVPGLEDARLDAQFNSGATLRNQQSFDALQGPERDRGERPSDARTDNGNGNGRNDVPAYTSRNRNVEPPLSMSRLPRLSLERRRSVSPPSRRRSRSPPRRERSRSPMRYRSRSPVPLRRERSYSLERFRFDDRRSRSPERETRETRGRYPNGYSRFDDRRTGLFEDRRIAPH